MVETKTGIKRIIKRYRDELTHSGITVTVIYLYGSYAYGCIHEGSDIDLIVVSADFAKFSLRERLELLGLAAGRIMEPIQSYGVTPEEIKQQKLSSFWNNILENEAVTICRDLSVHPHKPVSKD
jgi:predicted nucleotidyltransferase